MTSHKKDITLSECDECPRQQHYEDMFYSLWNEGERICRHCFTYQLSVRKGLQLKKQQLKQLENRL